MKKTILIFSLMAAAVFSQDICDTVSAANKKEAEEQARLNIAKNIASQIDYSSKDVAKVKNGEGSRKTTIVESIQSTMKNANAVKFTPFAGTGKGYSLSACISKKDAAAPYINSQKNLAAKLQIAANKAKISSKEYEEIIDIYYKLGDIALILEPLGYMNPALEKECEDAYEKAKAKYNEYAEQAGKGIYVESDNSSFSGKISSLIAGEGCVLSESAESSAITLKIKATECEQQTNEMANAPTAYYCKSCVEIDLQSNKTGKSPYKNNFTGSKVGGMDMGNACKKAAEKAVTETWEKIKPEIAKIKGDCK